MFDIINHIDTPQSLWTLKNYSHMSNCLSLNFGITILNFTINLPCLPVFMFYIPFSGIVIVVCLVVTYVLAIGIYSPLK